MKDNIDWDLKTKQILRKLRIWWNVLDLLNKKGPTKPNKHQNYG